MDSRDAGEMKGRRKVAGAVVARLSPAGDAVAALRVAAAMGLKTDRGVMLAAELAIQRSISSRLWLEMNLLVVEAFSGVCGSDGGAAGSLRGGSLDSSCAIMARACRSHGNIDTSTDLRSDRLSIYGLCVY
jgi:hypothetical protein